MRFNLFKCISIILFLLIILVSCYQQEFLQKKEKGLAFKSIYSLQLKKANEDPKTFLFLPEINIEMDYIVISDGKRSLVQGRLSDAEQGNELTLKGNEILIYTNCHDRYGITLDEEGQVVSSFKLKSHSFSRLRSEKLNLFEKTFEANLWQTDNWVDMKVYTSSDLPTAVSLGGCFNVDGAVLQMRGSKDGVQIFLMLQGYEKLSFDFASYEQLLNQNKNTAAKEIDLFWN